MIDQETLKKYLDYLPESGHFVWRMPMTKGKIKAGSVAGYRTRRGYVTIRLKGKEYQAHRLAWFYINGVWPSEYIDHINQIKWDNRICNLREATNMQNQQNSKMPNTNTSGVKGVSWGSSIKRWRVEIRVKGKKKHIGTYKALEDAKIAAIEARKQLHGEYARNA